MLRGIMRLMPVAALSAVLLAGVATVDPAAAQSPRRYVPPASQSERITVIDENGRRTTRITVRPRSFLDPGTATRDAFQYHYHDYALPPDYHAYHDVNDFKGSFQRMPFPAPFDTPGSRW
jgi:hypothetical protein